MGTELMDDDMLVDHLDPNQIDDSLLVGSLKINIADENCDTQHAMTVQPFSRVHEVKEQYAALSNRIPKRSDLKIKRHDDEGYEASELHDDTTMWEAGVNEDDITLYYSTPPFSVTIKEMDEKGDSHDIEVEDHFTIAQVKEIYSKEAYEGLVEADSLVYANDELDERKALYKYNVKEGAVLFVQREDISQIHTVYICADCGADVTLKKEDYIRCTHCGYRILYKKRTAQVCQYLAR